MDVTCISDLHGFYPELEGGDLLIVAGDLTARDTHVEYLKFLSWLHKQKYKHYIFIGGNHDTLLEKDEVPTSGLGNTTYLCDSGTEFEGLTIWGSPWTKTFLGINPKCTAFTLETEMDLAEKFDKIPHDIDILITHSPAYGILDTTASGKHVGSSYLHNWFRYGGRPKLHVCGHIHESYGEEEVFCTYTGMVKHVNASHVNERYQPVNRPIRVVL